MARRADSRSLSAHGFALLALLLVGGAACSSNPVDRSDAGNPADAFDATGDAPPIADGESNELPDGGRLIEDLTLLPNPSNALSYYVEWSTTEEADTHLTVACGSEWRRSYDDGAMTEQHSVFVMGLWEGASCRFLARGETEAGHTASLSTTESVGPLPDVLPNLDVPTRKPDEIQPGWTLFNLTNSFDKPPIILAMVDDRGRYRWYHQRSVSNHGSDTDVEVFEDHVLVGGNRSHFGPAMIDWEGNVTWKDNFRMHHEIEPSTDSKSFYYLREVDKCQQDVYSGALVKYDRESGQKSGEWPLCDYWFPPESNPSNDWSHLNAIEHVPGGDAVILSSRGQHSLFKFDLADEEVDWVMGAEGDFGLTEDEYFFRQHAPEIQPNGNILLFDNGSLPRGEFSRPYSQAIEIAYDTSEMSAEIVWKYRPDPDIFTPIWGDADRLKNGNTLVTFGFRDKTKNSRIMEVTKSKKKVWDLKAEKRWGWYRSERVADPPVGHVVAQ